MGDRIIAVVFTLLTVFVVCMLVVGIVVTIKQDSFESTHTCTEWGTPYTTYVPIVISSGKTTTTDLVPVHRKDCIGQWIKN